MAQEISKTSHFFRTRRIFTVVQLATWLNCSIPTARRRLKKLNVYTSYNRNGKYYTLPEVPKFDDNGLWRYRGVAFSKYGTLKKTVINLIRNSEAGLSAIELGELLHLQPRSFLSHFRDHPQLKREKHQNWFIYFAADEERNDYQKRFRNTITRKKKLPSDVVAIAILVETIKHPELTLTQLCGQLKEQKVKTTPEMVRNLFAYHGLTIKKKPHFPWSTVSLTIWMHFIIGCLR